MTDSTSAATTLRFIERMGLLWEGQGLPRIAGRILGYLALQPAPRTLDDIATALDVSKASVSNDARRLERLGLVTLTSRPGDRRDYYDIAQDLPVRVVSLKLAELEELDAVLDAARRLPDTPPVVGERLSAFVAFHQRAAHLLRGLLDAPGAPVRGTGIPSISTRTLT